MAVPVLEHVHRITIFDDQHSPTGKHVLVNVSGTGFPINIEATEGEAPFHAKVTGLEASKLRDKKHSKSKEEWESILLSTLLRSPSNPQLAQEDRGSLEVFALLSSSEISIVFRRTIGEIKQRLGEIPLRRNEDYEIDTISWAHTAVQRGDTLSSDLESLQSRYSDQESTITKLTKQLEDLITAKKEHETALLTRFAELLNAKKLKIRDQQRLLATVKVDPDRRNEVTATRSGQSKSLPATSRKGKRKVASLVEEEEDEDEDVFSETKGVKREDSEEEEQQHTPEASEMDEDVIEGDEDGGPPQESTKSNGNKPITAKPAKDAHEDVEMDDLPPPRAMPFGNKEMKDLSSAKEPDKSTIQQEAGNEDDETTDDDDDEL